MSAAAALPSKYGASIGRDRWAGIGLIVAFLLSVGAWSAMVPLSGAVVAIGRLEVVGGIKQIQHPTGGTIAQILVKDGDLVVESQALVRLDPTTAAANLAIIEDRLDALWIAEARLKAERDQDDGFVLPPYFAGRERDPSVADLMTAEQRLFAARTEARAGQQDQLHRQIDQGRSQIAGLEVQKSANADELAIAQREFDRINTLYAQNLVALSQVNALAGNVSRLKGEQGQFEASIAELGGKIAEIELRILSVDQSAVADAGKELGDVESSIDEYSQRRLAAADQLASMDLKAPTAGRVHQLAVHTIGGVIGPGDVLMTIVPSGSALDIQARIGPQDVEAVHVGDPATVRLAGLNRATTPDLEATVTMVGADLTMDPITRLAYYPVTLSLKPAESKTIGDIELVPGMPADTYIETSKRTFLDYLLQPILDRMSRALRER